MSNTGGVLGLTGRAMGNVPRGVGLGSIMDVELCGDVCLGVAPLPLVNE